jgi:Sec-independent protein translocase protein TatA
MGDVAKGVKNFKTGMRDDEDEDKKALTTDAGEPQVAEAGLKRDEAAKRS